METCILTEKTEFYERPKEGYGYVYIYLYNNRVIYIGQTRQSVEARYQQHINHGSNTAGAKITNKILWIGIKEDYMDYMEGLFFEHFNGICQFIAPKTETHQIPVFYENECKICMSAIDHFLTGDTLDNIDFLMRKDVEISLEKSDDMPYLQSYMRLLLLTHDIGDILVKEFNQHISTKYDIDLLLQSDYFHGFTLVDIDRKDAVCHVVDVRFDVGVFNYMKEALTYKRNTIPTYYVISSYEYINHQKEYDDLMSMEDAIEGLIVYDVTSNSWEYYWSHDGGYMKDGVDRELNKHAIQVCIERRDDYNAIYLQSTSYQQLRIA